MVRSMTLAAAVGVEHVMTLVAGMCGRVVLAGIGGHCEDGRVDA